MRTDKVVEEDEHGNEIVGRSKRGKALFGFVPSLELLVKALYEVVGNVIVETFHADVFYPIQRLDRYLIGKVAVAHNSLRSPHRLHGIQNGKRLWAVPVAIEMESENKAGFAVENEPEVVFFALYFDYGFIGMPLVRVEIECRNELYGNVLKHRGETGTPVADGRVGYLDIHHGTQNQSDIAEGVFAQVEHTQCHEDDMDRIAHSLKIRLTEQFGHGRSRDSRRLWYKQRMVAAFVTAAVVAVMLLVMVQKSSFAANGAGWVILRSGVNSCGGIRRPLMAALLAQILLMTMIIQSITIKVCFVVAFWAANLV